MSTHGEASKAEGEVPEFGGLALLLDGYFHEDFRTEFADHVAAASAFAKEASAEELATAKGALAAFIDWATSVDRETWQRALHRSGGAWRPRSLRPLADVAEALAAPAL